MNLANIGLPDCQAVACFIHILRDATEIKIVHPRSVIHQWLHIMLPRSGTVCSFSVCMDVNSVVTSMS